MKRNALRKAALNRTLISVAVASCFVTDLAIANPTAPTVVNGSAVFQQAGNLLQVTNGPNAIINWGSFSIGAGEITRFIQQSQASAVLNRVVGQDPSSILGALQSNGRVFLINPNGILFGAGAQIDMAGLVASTLNLSNADFLAGRLNFTEVTGAGSIVNQGSITTGQGGNVYLVAPDITHTGIITSPRGEVILAAGKSVELVDPGTPNLRVEINAPDNQARNLGQIAADSGRIGIYAGLINQSGTIRSDSAVVGENGRILLKATKNTTLEAGSITSANGPRGGNIEIQSGDTTLVSGTIEAKGTLSPPSGGGASATADGVVEGKGGTIHILGNKVGVIDNARIDVSGESGGGTVLVGGDFQGKNPEIQNAYRTFFGPDAQIRADALTSGDGGKVIVWSDDATRAYGTILARGGAQGGNGGFAEVSGKNYLDYRGITNLSATKGQTGTLLLDPSDIVIDNSSDNFLGGVLDLLSGLFGGAAGTSTITWNTIKNQLATTNTTITTSGSGGVGAITVSANSPDLATSNSLRLLAKDSITINGSITNTGNGAVEMYAGWDEISTATPAVSNSGSIALNSPINFAGDALLVATNSITQAPTAVITANKLSARAGDQVALDSATNMVNVVAGAADNCCSTAFNFRNGKALTIGSAFGTDGITSNDNDGTSQINVSVTGGALTVAKPVTANIGSVLLSSTGAVDVNSNVAAVGGPASVSITGGTVSIGNGVAIAAITTSGNDASVQLSVLNGSIVAGTGSSITAKGSDTNFGSGGNADITLQASDGITLSSGSISATGGNTLDTLGGGGGADILLQSAGGIDLTGSSLVSTPGTGTPSGVATTTVRVASTLGNNAPSGDLKLANITTTGDVLVEQGSITSGSSILHEAGKMVTAASAAFDISNASNTAGSIGTSSTGMFVTVSNLDARSQGGDIWFRASGPLTTIGGAALGGLTGMSVSGASGGINVFALNGDLTVAENVTNSGNDVTAAVVLSAASTDKTLTVNPNVAVSTPNVGGGGINYGADNIVLDGSSTVVSNPTRTIGITTQTLTRNIEVGNGTPSANVLHISQDELATLNSADLIGIGASNYAGNVSTIGNINVPTQRLNFALAGGNFTAANAISALANTVQTTLGGATTGSINITGQLTGTGLFLNANTGVNAGNAANAVAQVSLLNQQSGNVTFSNNSNLQVVTVQQNASGGNVSITNGTGTLLFQGGAGGMTLNGGSLVVSTPGAITLGDTFNGNSLTLTSGSSITQSAGTVTMSGTTNLNAGGSISLTLANNDFGTVILNNTGANDVAITDLNAVIIGASSVGTGALAMKAGGPITQTGAITQAAGAGTATFNAGANAITLTNAGNDFTGAVSLNNSGANDVAVTDANAIVLGASSVGSGTLAVDASSTAFVGNLAANNFTFTRGTSTLQAGNTLSLSGTTSIANGATVVAEGGIFDASGGTINVSGIFETGAGTVNAATMNVLSGGILRGAGTVNAIVNNSSGTVSPGASPGILTINGDYVQGPNGVLALDIGGTTPGLNYDQLLVTGNVMLQSGTPGARLDATLINGFAPSPGSAFRVIQSSGAVTGTFATANLPSGLGLSVTYLPTNVDVVALTQIAVTAPLEAQITATNRIQEVLNVDDLTHALQQVGTATTQEEKTEGLQLCR